MTGRKFRTTVLALLAAMFAACALCLPARAEAPVGLEAQGVDAYTALHNDLGLDVRDAEGRPVSAEVIRKQLSAARRESLKQAAAVSRLPKAHFIFRLLELLNFLGGSWSLPFQGPVTQSPWALPLRSRSEKDLAPGSGLIILAALTLTLLCCRTQTIQRRSLQKSAVLRC